MPKYKLNEGSGWGAWESMAIQKQHKKAGLDEKNSGNDRDLNAISDFRNVVQDCNLMDMGSQGYLFT